VIWKEALSLHHAVQWEACVVREVCSIQRPEARYIPLQGMTEAERLTYSYYPVCSVPWFCEAEGERLRRLMRVCLCCGRRRACVWLKRKWWERESVCYIPVFLATNGRLRNEIPSDISEEKLSWGLRRMEDEAEKWNSCGEKACDLWERNAVTLLWKVAGDKWHFLCREEMTLPGEEIYTWGGLSDYSGFLLYQYQW